MGFLAAHPAVAVIGGLAVGLGALGMSAESSSSRIKKALGGESLGDFNLDVDSVTVDVPSPKVKYADGATKLVDGIFGLLTDGLKDTPQQKEQMKTDVNSYVDGVLSDVDISESKKLASLKEQFEGGFIDAATYTARVKEVTDQSAILKADLETLRSETLTMVENLSGAPTATVQAQFDNIEELKRYREVGVKNSARISRIRALKRKV
jgi:hypothetical protein